MSQVDWARFNGQLPRFQLGDIQDVVEHPQQQAARVKDRLKGFLRGLAFGFQIAQLRQTQHAIERCTDFMTHVGQELALDACEALGLFSCCFALLLQRALLGHIPDHHDGLGQAQRQQARFVDMRTFVWFGRRQFVINHGFAFVAKAVEGL